MKESVINGDSSVCRTGFGRMPSNVSYFLAILLWIFASRVLAIRVFTRFISTILFPTFQVVCYGSLITHDIYAGVATNLYWGWWRYQRGKQLIFSTKQFLIYVIIPFLGFRQLWRNGGISRDK
jgi:hypothetical protein